MTFAISLVGLGTILIANYVVGVYFRFGIKHNWFFELEHFLGGFFLATLFGNFIRSPYAVVLLVLAASAVWECFEYVTGNVPKFSRFLMRTFRLRKEDVKYVWRDIWPDTLRDYNDTYSDHLAEVVFS